MPLSAKKTCHVLPAKVHDELRRVSGERVDFDTVVGAVLRDLPPEKTKAVRFWALIYQRANGLSPANIDPDDEDCSVEDTPDASNPTASVDNEAASSAEYDGLATKAEANHVFRASLPLVPRAEGRSEPPPAPSDMVSVYSLSSRTQLVDATTTASSTGTVQTLAISVQDFMKFTHTAGTVRN